MTNNFISKYKFSSKKELYGLIEDHLHEHLPENGYVFECNASDFLNLDRLDIAIKIGFIKNYIEGKNDYYKKIWRDIYLSHIKAFSFGNFHEPFGNKKNESDFIDTFIDLYTNIKNKSFNSKKTIIPISSNGIPLNGAHRIACCVYLEKNIHYTILKCNGTKYDHRYFSNKLNNTAVFEGIRVLIERKNSYKIGIIWPKGNKILKYNKEIDNSVFFKSKFTYNQHQFFTALVYCRDNWVKKSILNDAMDLNNKTLSCHSNDSISFFIRNFSSEKESITFKEEVRLKEKKDKHSIHITDNKIQSLEILNFIMNPINLTVYNSLRYKRFKSLVKRIAKEKEKLKLSGDFLISGSALPYLLGGRLMNDIDFYLLDKTLVKENYFHNNYLKKFGFSNEMISDYRNQIQIFNVFFIGPKIILDLKKMRNESKDLIDLNLLEEKLFFRKNKNYNIKVNLIYYKDKFYIKFRTKLVEILTKLRIKHFIKSILNKN